MVLGIVVFVQTVLSALCLVRIVLYAVPASLRMLTRRSAFFVPKAPGVPEQRNSMRATPALCVHQEHTQQPKVFEVLRDAMHVALGAFQISQVPFLRTSANLVLSIDLYKSSIVHRANHAKRKSLPNLRLGPLCVRSVQQGNRFLVRSARNFVKHVMMVMSALCLVRVARNAMLASLRMPAKQSALHVLKVSGAILLQHSTLPSASNAQQARILLHKVHLAKIYATLAHLARAQHLWGQLLRMPVHHVRLVYSRILSVLSNVRDVTPAKQVAAMVLRYVRLALAVSTCLLADV